MMGFNEAAIWEDVRARLSDYRFYHSQCVAACAKKLAEAYGWDPAAAWIAGAGHDVLKEQPREQALEYFASHGITLSPLELACPKLWHAMAGAVYLRETYGLPEEIITAVRYHTTGRSDMTLPEKILFVADFISDDRDYPGVDDMRSRAAVSLASAMEEGLRFTIEDLAKDCRPIHPDTLNAYNQIVLQKGKKE